MATELQDTLARLVSKSNVLIEKYRVLAAEKEELDVQLATMQEEVDNLRMENEKLHQDNEYLKMARSIVPDQEKAAQARSMISNLVRDIDKCISQLNE